MNDRPSQREVRGYFRLMVRDDRGAWQRVRGGWWSHTKVPKDLRKNYYKSARVSDLVPWMIAMVSFFATQLGGAQLAAKWIIANSAAPSSTGTYTPVPTAIIVLPTMAGVLTVIPLLYFVLTGPRRVIARASLLRLPTGHCMVCTYDLLAQIPSDDGCRLCPECGSAWKLPDDARERRLTAPAPRP